MSKTLDGLLLLVIDWLNEETENKRFINWNWISKEKHYFTLFSVD